MRLGEVTLQEGGDPGGLLKHFVFSYGKLVLKVGFHCVEFLFGGLAIGDERDADTSRFLEDAEVTDDDLELFVGHDLLIFDKWFFRLVIESHLLLIADGVFFAFGSLDDILNET